MRVRGWCLAMLAGALFAAVAHAEEPQAQAQPAAQQGMPDWVPGPLANDRQEPAPGRVAARNLGLAFTLPETWRAADVSWRELDATEAQAINSLAEAGLIVELAGKGDDKQRLLTLYRVPLEGWREADRVGKAGPGRITLNSSDKGYVVVRPADADKAGRYATLRGSVEDAIGTLALYDAHKEERHLRPKVGTDFAGKLVDGSPVKLHLETGGLLTLTYGNDNKQLSGKWLQRESQIIGHLTGQPAEINPTLLFHFDGVGLVIMKWDERVFGNIGGRMDKPQ